MSGPTPDQNYVCVYVYMSKQIHGYIYMYQNCSFPQHEVKPAHSESILHTWLQHTGQNAALIRTFECALIFKVIMDTEKSFRTVQKILIHYSFRFPQCKQFYIKHEKCQTCFSDKANGKYAYRCIVICTYMDIHTHT